MKCVYSGSFDPPTIGHIDIIRRAAKIFDEVDVTIFVNIAKRYTFSVQERLDMMRRATRDIPGVTVHSFDGLLVDYMRQTGARVIIRGVRGVADLESESHMADINRRLYPECETLFLPTSPELMHISSSVVTEAGHFGANVDAFVPPEIRADVAARFSAEQRKD